MGIMIDRDYLKDLNIIYIEVTNKCNIACEYCYAVQKSNSRHIMDFPLFKTIVDSVVANSSQDKFSIIFHGGEPLLAKPVFFRECMEYARKEFTNKGKTVDFGLQSNLLLLTDEMCEILKRFDVSVSTSIDGPEPIHDKARSGWKTTIDNYFRLKNSGIIINFIAVCTQHNKDHIEDLYIMARDMGSKTLQLNIASSTQSINPRSSYSPLTSEEIFQIFKECFRCTLKYGITEKKLGMMVRNFLCDSSDRMHTLSCDSPFCHAGTRMLVFTPDGNMYPCSPAVPIGVLGDSFSLGKISETNDGFYDTLAQFHEKNDKYANECSKCEAAKICDFGCPAFDRIDPVTTENHCIATKRLYDFFLQTPVNLLEKCLYESDSD